MTTPGQAFDAALAGLHAKLDALTEKVDALAAQLGEAPPPPSSPQLVVQALLVSPTAVTITWDNPFPDVTEWRVGRDGEDVLGHGPWATTVPADARRHTFNLLVEGRSYRFTVTALRGATPVASAHEDVTVPAPSPSPSPSPPPSPGLSPSPTPGADGPTAAARLGWGTPHQISDEFDYTGPPDPSKWRLPPSEGWPGHAGNGRRMPRNVSVAGGLMTLRGDANGDTGWVRQNLAVRYGRWEIRSRSRNTGPTGGSFHPLHLIWPSTEKWPQDGEYDWLEYFDPDARKASAFLHYPHSPGPVQQEYFEKPGVDMREFHNFAFEWAPSGLTGWIDGEQWYQVSGGATATRRNIQEMPSGYLTCQLDNFTGDGGLRPAVFEIAWVRYWPI